MSYTGTYKFDPKQGRMVCISKRMPNTQVFDCYVPEGGYYSENLGGFVESRRQKRRILREKGLVEKGDRLTKKEV